MRKSFLLPAAAFAIATAGCAASSGTGDLPAPPTSAVVRITAAENGKTVAVGVGKTFDVALVGIPTAGYLWKPSSTPDFLKETGTSGGPTTEAQKQPGFTGGNHWEVTSFVATRAGSGLLKFEQRRPWETNQPPDDTFSVTIEAK
jgi:predicted secreted protein